jgi:hypothetical protein
VQSALPLQVFIAFALALKDSLAQDIGEGLITGTTQTGRAKHALDVSACRPNVLWRRHMQGLCSQRVQALRLLPSCVGGVP